MNKTSAIISATAYAFFVGLSFLITKLVVPFASPILILAHRFTIAFLLYGILLILSKQKLSLDKKKLRKILPATLVYPLMFFTLQLYGLSRSTSSEAGIIFATVPILAILIVAFMGKRPTVIQLITVSISVSGVVYILSQNMASSNGNTLGLILLFISALSFAIYTIVVKNILSITTLHELTFVLITVGFIIFNLMYIVQTDHLEQLVKVYTKPFLSIDYTLGILYLGTFASVLASLCSNYALTSLSAPEFSVFSNLSTLISIASGALILGENLSPYHYIGGGLILIGVIGANFSGHIQTLIRNASNKKAPNSNL